MRLRGTSARAIGPVLARATTSKQDKAGEERQAPCCCETISGVSPARLSLLLRRVRREVARIESTRKIGGWVDDVER